MRCLDARRDAAPKEKKPREGGKVGGAGRAASGDSASGHRPFDSNGSKRKENMRKERRRTPPKERGLDSLSSGTMQIVNGTIAEKASETIENQKGGESLMRNLGSPTVNNTILRADPGV